VDVVVRGLRQALVTLMVAAGLVSLGSGAVFTRMHDHERGTLPTVEDHGSAGGVLTGPGVFLFVSLPLFAAGAVLFGVA
jgi:hypothetical protein